jgi:hypothetical protein
MGVLKDYLCDRNMSLKNGTVNSDIQKFDTEKVPISK